MPPEKQSRSSIEKPLPQNLEAERSVLGAVLLSGIRENETDTERLKPIAAAADVLNSGDFFLANHEIIFRRMTKLISERKPVDLVTLTEALHAAGELQQAGGTPYVASLTDGMPRISNITHYAGIVLEKARLRQIIHMTHNFQQRAFEASDENSSGQIFADMNEYMKMSGNGHRKDRLVAVDFHDFLLMKLDAIDFIIEPILPVANSAMIWSLTGAGKTYIMLYMAYCIAAGVPDCFVWNVPKARPVVYVDGEMDAQTLQERQGEISKGLREQCGPASIPSRGFFKVITPDLQPKYPPRINTKEGRARIEEHFQEGCLCIADNISTLSPGADEKETEDWAPVQEWILYLRRKKVAMFLVHHGNASGQKQLGSSKKEHQLSCNLRLRAASDWTPDVGLRVEARLDKLRRRGKDGHWNPKWGQPFEIALRVDGGAATFSHQPMLKLLRERAIQMLLAGMRENDVAQETGLNRFQVYRLHKKVKSDGIAAAESSED